MNDPKGFFPMRFTCSPNGKLLKGAPGNYKCGQVYPQPYHMSKFPFWELLTDTPVLKVPPPLDSDNVFDEPVYVADDEAIIQPLVPDKKMKDERTEEIKKLYKRSNMRLIDADNGIFVDGSEEETPEPEKEPEPTPVEVAVEKPDVEPSAVDDREEYKKLLTESGVEFNDKARTTTLKKLVDALESEE